MALDRGGRPGSSGNSAQSALWSRGMRSRLTVARQRRTFTGFATSSREAMPTQWSFAKAILLPPTTQREGTGHSAPCRRGPTMGQGNNLGLRACLRARMGSSLVEPSRQSQGQVPRRIPRGHPHQGELFYRLCQAVARWPQGNCCQELRLDPLSVSHLAKTIDRERARPTETVSRSSQRKQLLQSSRTFVLSSRSRLFHSDPVSGSLAPRGI
jgi:hypothetical protein